MGDLDDLQGTSLERLGRRVRELRGDACLTQEQVVARLAGCDRARLSRIENGRELPSVHLVCALQAVLGGAGELLTLRWRAWHDQHLKELGLGEDGADEPTAGTPDQTLRDLATMAATVSRLMHHADPDPITLIEIGEDLEKVMATYYTADSDLLLSVLAHRQRQIHRALHRRVSLRVHQELRLLGGQSSYLLARLAFHIGHGANAATFAALAAQHAKGEDPLLAGSVALLQTCMSFHNGCFSSAADTAAAARRSTQPPAHPFLRARLTAFEAAAHAGAGDMAQAREAFLTLRDTLAKHPDSWMFDHTRDRLHAALTPTDLRTGESAEWHACATLGARDATQATTAGAVWAALAENLVPNNPVAAADAGRYALAVMAGSPGEAVIQRISHLHTALTRRRPDLPELDELAAMLHNARTPADR
ncbi:helix-turn-helix transcriptional regulator [Frankia sp. CNm7]|uniref:Helix-turn-helix transcriptional regulator n=1 Tax=Frankia nepalensis TaxID=1836974 RepID=A0A937RHV3_9ACTN|nr:helix-turn-helix transcriptional regulator [Frankia nepalensis]MBL7502008.1 helix-turn-helix transcriptional regulator [Frankia nepalensis]MBL7510316.1 helix-turn-helix transcriptional regulator [Frankia nepalensis]MBL7517014.1 helix-turn-helix transcriptional regulator [Frankia nepalensis]MBL7630447.1 helix-turn-helix transcriptional regulator [Frankia nepalensis]